MPKEILMQQQISFHNMEFTTGTWALTNASNIWSMNKTATDETSTVDFDIIFKKSQKGRGVKLETIEIPIFIGTADMDAAPALVISKGDWDATKAAGVSGADPTGSAITTTTDAVVTLQTTWQWVTWTVTSPTFDNATGTGRDITYNCRLTLDAAATTVLKVGQPVVYYRED